MMLNANFYLCLACILAIPTCGLKPEEVPPPSRYDTVINTTARPINPQPKTTYRFPQKGLSLDNLFKGARLNGARLAGNTLKLTISPESTPINGSSWYAFRIISTRRQQVVMELNYTFSEHRYNPKWSTDGQTWTPVNTAKIRKNKSGSRMWCTINLPADTLWIAAQEIVDSEAVTSWCRQLEEKGQVKNQVIGKSAQERDIHCLDIYQGDARGKPIIAIMGRHHPPEVTGHFALQAFVERLLEKEAVFFEKYRLLVFPLINPDGVDQGHWRHNVQGIDLNRDYADYRQPEIKAITDHLIKTAQADEARVLMGLDFHSTYRDVYYTSRETEGVELAGLKDKWLSAISNGLKQYNYKLREEQHSVRSNPSCQHWFYHQFRALGITYEIGDNTSREFIRIKANVSADALVKLLMEETER
jgi:cytosolic carboxypeptidase protein 6